MFKWVCWLMIWLSIMALPLLTLSGIRKSWSPIFFVVLTMSFLLLVFGAHVPFLLCAFALILASWQFVWWGAARQKKLRSPGSYAHVGLLTLGWIASFYYFAWFYNVALGGRGALVSFLLSAMFLLFFLPIFCWRTAQSTESMQPAARWPSMAAAILGIGWLILEAFRVDRIDTSNFFHHWGVFVGPVQAMHQGAWLLWDTPAQYGFLSMAFIAVLPFKTVWTSLYVANSFFVALQGVLIFLLLRRARSTLWGTLVTFAVTFFSMHLIAGLMPEGSGVSAFPSVSGYRFFWVVATLAFICLEPTAPWAFWFENILFLIGALWSPESFFYTGLMWTSFFWGDWIGRKEAGPAIVKRVLVKVGLLVGFGAVLSAVYRITLGHTPDFFMFFEYAVSFGIGFGSLSMNFPGPALLFLYFAGVLGAVMWRWHGALKSQLGFLLACFSALWACGTYYVARSHPNNATNLAPLFCAAVAGLLIVVARFPNIKSQFLLWLSPLLGGLFLTIFLDRPLLPAYVKNLHQMSFGNVERFVPSIEAPIKLLIHKIPPDGETRLASWSGDNLMGRDGTNFFEKAWLPLSPLTLAYPLREFRKPLFFRRRLERLSGCGWVLYGDKYARNANPVVEFEKALTDFGWAPHQSYKEGAAELVLWCQNEKSIR